MKGEEGTLPGWCSWCVLFWFKSLLAITTSTLILPCFGTSVWITTSVLSFTVRVFESGTDSSFSKKKVKRVNTRVVSCLYDTKSDINIYFWSIHTTPSPFPIIHTTISYAHLNKLHKMWFCKRSLIIFVNEMGMRNTLFNVHL